MKLQMFQQKSKCAYVYATIEEKIQRNFKFAKSFLDFARCFYVVNVEAITPAVVGLANGVGLNLARLVG